MGQETVTELEELRKLYQVMQDRVTDLSLRLLAIQSLLQERNQFSSADVEARLEELQQLWALRLQTNLHNGLEKRKQELMRQLLRGIDRGVLKAAGTTIGSADPRFTTQAV